MADKKYVLGSGEAFCMPYNPALKKPEEIIEALFTEENRWGHVKNGATLTVSNNYYNVRSDLGETDENIITSDSGSLQLGTLTVSESVLKSTNETARIVVSEKGDGKILKLGGISNATGEKYFIGFKHKDPVQGDLLIIIAGKNNGELSLTLNADSETILQPTFACSPLDDEGSKVFIKFCDPVDQSADL